MDKASPVKNTGEGESLYHNSKKLLENYRILTFILNTKQIALDGRMEAAAKEKHCSVDELLSQEKQYGDECFEGKAALNEQVRVLQKILQTVNAAFKLLQKCPGREKYYVLLREKYMEPPDPESKAKDTWYIGENEVSRITYYRQLKRAISAFDHILWEISGAEISALIYNIDDILKEWYECK